MDSSYLAPSSAHPNIGIESIKERARIIRNMPRGFLMGAIFDSAGEREDINLFRTLDNETL